MKKDYLIPLLILGALFGFSLWNSAEIKTDTARWSNQLKQAVQFIPSENWDAIERTLQNSYDDWQTGQTYLHIVLEHDAIDDADAMFRRAFAFAETHDTQELQAELANLIDQLNLLAETERLSLKNIL